MSLLALLIAFAACGSAAPRLFALVVVDQLKPEHLMSGKSGGGFDRLLREGFVFENARHPHVPTETGPGHAAVSTGRMPYAHGIIANGWFDRRSGSQVYCVADSLHKTGPQNLLAYTFGDALKAASPASKVVSVSFKDRSAVLMGGKKADAAIWFDKKANVFVTSTYYGAAPGWLAAFNASIKPPPEVSKTPEADRLTLRLALEAARRSGLGADEAADVLAVSFSGTDYAGHGFGGKSAQMAAQLASLDGILAELLDGLTKLAGEGQVVVALTSDHGGTDTGSRRIVWQELGAAMEKALQQEVPAKAPWIVSDDLVPHLYLNREQAKAMKLEWPAFLRRAARKLEAVPGVAKVYVPEEMPENDAYSQTYAFSHLPSRSGDLLVRMAPDVIAVYKDEVSTHGSPYEPDARAPLIFWGAGIAKGRSSEPVRVIELAQTAASLLGVPMAGEPGSRPLPVAAPSAAR